LCKKQAKAAYNTSKWWDPFPDPAHAGVLVDRVALFIIPFLIWFAKATKMTRKNNSIMCGKHKMLISSWSV